MTKARDIASAIPAPSTVSSAELGFLDGVTSAIQTQVDAKTAKSTLTTTGDIYYASAANTPARLAIGSTSNVLTVAGGIPSWAAPAGSSFVGCSISNTNTNVSIANNTNVKVAMNTEEFDTDGFHDNSTNNTRITIPAGKAGTYLLTGSTFFDGHVTGERSDQIYKNNSEIKATFTPPTGTANCGILVTAVVSLAVSDYVEFVIKQNSGGALNSSWAYGQYGWFSAVYLGA